MAVSSLRLDRLPLELFVNLVPTDEEEEDNEGASAAAGDDRAPVMMDAAVVHQRFCDKLKDFARRRQRTWKQPHPQFHTQTTTTPVWTVGDFLQLSLTELVHGCDPLFTFAECQTLRQRICIEYAAAPTTVRALQCQPPRRQLPTDTTPTINNSNNNNHHPHRVRVISTGIPVLDQLFGSSGSNNTGGGLRLGTLTELVGPPGSGKTQLAWQFCLAAAASHSTAAHIETEDKLCGTRFRDLAVAHMEATTIRRRNHDHAPSTPSSPHRVQETLSRIRMYTGRTLEELQQALVTVELEACALCPDDDSQDDDDNEHDPPLRLVVLDSIAAPVRRHCFGRSAGAAAAAEQAQFVLQLAARIKRLAETIPLAVVLVNQMGGSSKSGGSTPSLPITDGALGNSWHHCATTRLFLQPQPADSAGTTTTTTTVTVTKSSFVPHGTSCTLYLGQNGFTDVPPPDAAFRGDMHDIEDTYIKSQQRG